MAFEMVQNVLFKHCDPAGIVFYPRYFEMMNDCVEQFFDEVLQWSFADLHREGGVPTAQINTRFAAPSRHGDRLKLCLTISAVGSRSATYRLAAHCDTELRFETEATLVHVTPEGTSTSWPMDIQKKLQELKEPQNAT